MIKKIIIIITIFLIGINFTYAKEQVQFSSCVDGDTIKITSNNKIYTVRMLAIDTPESVHPTKGVEYYGKEASEYTCNLIKNAKRIELEYDDHSDKTDKYDRLLAWVFVDDILLQKELVANGYAKIAYLYDDYKYTKELETNQELASAKSIGIWDKEAEALYNKKNNIEVNKSVEVSDNYSTKEIIIIGILLLIIVFVGDKTIKKKAKKKLKKYLG